MFIMDTKQLKLPKLPRKRRMFSNYIIAGKSGAESARLAGFSVKTAGIIAANLLSLVIIQEYIQIKSAKLLAEIKENQLSTLRMIQNCAHFDIKDLYDEEGNLKNIHDIPDRTAAAICGITVKSVLGKTIKGKPRKMNYETIDIKLSDRAKYLEMLAKAQGIYSDNAPVDLNLGIIVLPAKKEVGDPVDPELLKRHGITQEENNG